jgi:RND family efflux transporter MFP subunit
MTEATHKPNPILRFGLPVVIVAGGIGTFAALKATKPEAKTKPEDSRGTLVDAVPVKLATHTIDVVAQGRVIPSRQVMLGPEVGGKIVWLSDEVVPGGRLAKGETMLRIDAREYKLTRQQQEAAVDRARLELEVERGRKKVAEREWELLGGNEPAPVGEQPAESLALRGPQLRTAKVAVEAAQSGLDRAKLNVDRTVVRAPFNGMVQTELAEIGQIVGPQTPLVTLIGTDEFWVQVSVPVDNLAWLRIPGVNAEEGKGSTARVWQDIGGDPVERTGRIVRLLGDLDSTGGMARVLVAIDDPLGLRNDAAKGALPLLVGAFVNVRIAAGEIEHVIEIPRTALRGGNRVYLIGDDGTLQIRDVTIAWRYQDTVLIRGGLEAGDRVVTSRLGEVIPGMKVRTLEQGETAEKAAATAKQAQ